MEHKKYDRFIELLLLLGIFLLLLSLYFLEYVSEKWCSIAVVAGLLSLETALFLMIKFP